MSAHCSDSDSIDEENLVESRPLVSTLSQSASVRRSLKFLRWSSAERFCIKSKAVHIILLCSVIVGFIHFVAVNAALELLTELSSLLVIGSLPFVILYSFVAFVLVFYPLNGFLADIYCGRYKTIAISLTLILCSCIVALVPVVFYFFHHSNSVVVIYVFAGFALLTATIGIAGYGANFIQFGLDQLLEAPNQQQALFVHWALWCYDLLSVVVVGFAAYIHCNNFISSIISQVVIVVTFVLFILGFLCAHLLYVGCHKRQLYYTELKQHNPYKGIVKILSFAIKKKHPFQRSSFTYYDGERPSRLDFAKEGFGGPFSTEQVEDVKTLLRIVLILLTVGPIFVMELLPSNAILRYYIGLHIVLVDWRQHCTWEWVVLYSGLLRYCISTIFLPVYIWIVFTLLYNKVPRILSRLGLGIFLYFLGTVCLLIIELAGHGIQDRTDTKCIFNISNDNNITSESLTFPILGMHWSVLIPFDLLIGIGPTLVTVTMLEFISAQSPRSMKGLLFGLFFAIRGIFQLVTSIILTPFASMEVWSGMHPSNVSCLSRYLLLTCIISLLGVILFLIVGRKYKYRERDEITRLYSRALESRGKDN